MTGAMDPFSAVDLASEGDFSLGRLSVRPSAGRVDIEGRAQRVEPRVMQVLIVLVRNLGLTVTRDQLIEACWEGRIVSDDAVSRVIAQVRAISRLSDPPAFKVETVTKVGFRLSAETGAPDPAPSPSPAQTAAPLLTQPPRRLGDWMRNRVAVICAAIAIAVLAAVGWFVTHGRTAAASPPLVAIAAFEGAPSDPIASALAHGLNARITDLLGKIPTEVRVAQVSGAAPPAGARLVVRGDVQTEASQARVDVQLLDPGDGSILWADTFYRPPQQSLQLQDDVGMAAASIVRLAAPEVAQGRPAIPAAALAGYLKAARWFRTHTDSASVSEIIPPLVQAVGQAPNFAAAWARLAEAYRFESRVQDEAEQNEFRVKARLAVSRALSLDPNSGFAHAVQSALQPEWAWKARMDELREAEVLSPSDPDVLQKRVNMLWRMGRLEDQRKTEQMIAQLDMFSQDSQYQAWSVELSEGDLTKAYADLIQLQSKDPGAVLLWFSYLDAALKARNKAAATLGLKGLEAAWPEIVADRHFTEAGAAAMLSSFRRRTDDLLQGRDQHASDEAQAVADFNRASTDGRGQGCAMDLIPRLAEYRPDLAWVVVEELYLRRGYVGSRATCGRPLYADRQAATWPLFTPEAGVLRRDVRIWRIFKAVGLARFWSESGLWPDFCRDPSIGYDCREQARKALAAS